MAQQPEIDQKKLFTQTLIISMVIWLIFIMGWSYFARPPVSDKPAEEIVQEIDKLRQDKDYAEALRKAQELSTRFGGSENGALGLLLEAKIFYVDKQDAREAYNRLRRLEEFYPHTRVYQEEGRKLIEEVCAKIDEQNSTLATYRFLDTLVGLLGRGNYSYVLAIALIALGVRLILFPLTNKQFASMRKMLQIAPKLQELQQKYSGQELMQRQMALYKKYGVNPMSGCLFALIPLPHPDVQYVPCLSGAVPQRRVPVDEQRTRHAVSGIHRQQLGAVRCGAHRALCAQYVSHKPIDHYRPVASADAEDDGALHDGDVGNLFVAVPIPRSVHPVLDAHECVLYDSLQVVYEQASPRAGSCGQHGRGGAERQAPTEAGLPTA